MILWVFLAGLVFAFAGSAWAQVPTCGVAGGVFEIDGDPFCDAGTLDGSTDWCPAAVDACVSVFPEGTVFDPAVGVAVQGLYSWQQDGNFGVPNSEVNIFGGGSNKNNDYIVSSDGWTFKSGGGFPQKNDITDATIYTFEDGLGDRWLVFSMATRSENGASHADIEFNLAGLTAVDEPSGGNDGWIRGNGPEGGRTPLDGVTNRPRDFILSVDFTTGGAVDRADFLVWQSAAPDTGFHYAAPPTGAVDPSTILICTNNPTSQPPTGVIPEACWGAIGQDGLPADALQDQQWAEFAVNLGAFGFSDQDLCSGNSTVIFKTRSSPSFTAELKDHIIIPFQIVSPPSCSLDGPAAVCSGDIANITSTVSGGACTYNWSIIAGTGSFDAGGGLADTFADVIVSGSDTVKVQLTVNCDGCESEPCVWAIFPKANPTCSISGPDPVCNGTTNAYTSTVNPVGGSVTYLWSVTGNGSISGSATGSSVQVLATGAGSYTVNLSVMRDGCPGSCSKPVTVNANPTCSIEGPDPVCAETDGHVYTSSVNPAGGTVTYLWSVTGNGSISGSATGSSVTVDAGAAGSYTVHLTIDRNGCPGSCSKPVTVNANPTCSISGPSAVCEGESAVPYTSSVNPAGGSVEYLWSVTGNGTIVGSATGSSVIVDPTGSGSFTVHLNIDRNGCPGSCSKPVTVNPGPTCSISGPDPVCADTDGHVYTSSVNPPGGTVEYLWSVTGNGSISGSATGSSVTVDAGGAGSYTVNLTVGREGCIGTCSKPVTVNANPTCSIVGEVNPCIEPTENVYDYTVTVSPSGGQVTYVWSLPAECGSIVDGQGTASVIVEWATLNPCLLSVAITREGCSGGCDLEVTPVNCEPPGCCWMTSGGFLNAGMRSGRKDNTFGGNVGPPPSGSWQHVARDMVTGRNIINFHSQDATVLGCSLLEPGPCHPEGEVNVIEFGGTGFYNLGKSRREYEATWTARVEDHGEPGRVGDQSGGCGTPDFYTITIRNADTDQVVFFVEGFLDGGNLQVRDCKSSSEVTVVASREGGLAATEQGTGFGAGLPARFGLFPALPNPTRSSSSIRFGLPESSKVRLVLYNIRGQEIGVLVDDVMDRGYKTVTVDLGGRGLPSGIYLYRLEASGLESRTRFVESQKMLLIE